MSVSDSTDWNGQQGWPTGSSSGAGGEGRRSLQGQQHGGTDGGMRGQLRRKSTGECVCGCSTHVMGQEGVGKSSTPPHWPDTPDSGTVAVTGEPDAHGNDADGTGTIQQWLSEQNPSPKTSVLNPMF